jgi:hypothetical protein
MPTTTRAMQKMQTQPNKNSVQNVGIKRKLDGRKVLGQLDGSKNKSVQNTRKILAPRLNNKNIPAGSESIRNRRTGLKDSAGEFVNNLKKTLSITKQKEENLKNSKSKQSSSVEKQTYTGHDKFLIVPLSNWRNEIKNELIRQEKFFNYEESVKDNENESPEIAMGIFEYMKWREQKYEMLPYFQTDSSLYQSSFKVKDRRSLIDWMVEFQELQESTHETLYLAIRLCDYYFGRRKVSQNHLQLYAFVGFLLASKFEERWPPLFEDMIQVSDNQYCNSDFIKAEMNMLEVLNFDVNIPISYRYLRRYCKCIGMDMRSMTVSRFYLELTLMEYEFIFEKQSEMAAACLWIAMSTIGFDSFKRNKDDAQDIPQRFLKKYWSEQLSYYTGVNEWEILPLARRIATVVRDHQHRLRNLPVDEINEEDYQNGKYDNVQYKVSYKKYASRVFFNVARKPILSDDDFKVHIRRCESERIDFEAFTEPSNKRRSTGCTAKLQKMNLKSNTPNIPERITSQNSSIPEKSKNIKEILLPTEKLENTEFYSCKSVRPEENEENKENSQIVILENSDLDVVSSQN